MSSPYIVDKAAKVNGVVLSILPLDDVSSRSTLATDSTAQRSSTQDLEAGVTQSTRHDPSSGKPRVVPSKPRSSRIRAWYEYWRFDVFTVYRQLWLLIIVGNTAAIIITIVNGVKQPSLPLAGCTNAAVANLLAGILVRQDYVKNAMYAACWSVPHSAPLWLRRRLAFVYENGGVHSGAGVSAVLWFVVFTGFLWTDFARHSFSDPVVLLFDCMLAVLLLSIVATAIPQVRRRYHDLFENAHRWAGWFGIALFWVSLILFARDEVNSLEAQQSLASSLVRLPAFWMLIIISLHAIYPWVLLRKVAVIRADRLTDHAIRLYFDPKERIPPLHGMAISDAPLREWHAFASIPDIDGSDSGAASCIISNAGDWTSKTIRSPRPYYYMRGVHATGVLAMASIFSSVIVMATGSGIGPCLAGFGHLPCKIHVIWSAPSPVKVFGKKIYDAVLQQDPSALIWDTRKDGRRPDMVELAEKAYHERNAEAVFFISNRGLTRKVVRGLRERGVAAYAPVFDS